MAQKSRIEWTESTWNPVVGCTRVSDGCHHCYAERMAKRIAAMAEKDRARGADPGRKANYEAVITSDGRWNGRVSMDWKALEDPLGWRAPRTVFVNSMSDLFHRSVTTSFIGALFEIVGRCPHHTFQVLTKRPARAVQLSCDLTWHPNLWLGTSVEDERVLHRVEELRSTGARLRFLSMEPLLGPVDALDLTGIHWVVVGGESGPGARPMRPEWVRRIRTICAEQRVPFFFKQWGGVNKKAAGRELEGRTWDEMPERVTRS